MKTPTRNLRQAIEGLAPLVGALTVLEGQLDSLDRMFEGVPRDCEIPAVLEQCQKAADRRFRQIVGKAVEDRASHEDCRHILKCFETLAWRIGANLDTAAIPATAEVWTRDDGVDRGVYYDPIPDGGARQFAGAKYRLTTRVRLNPDGSLIGKPRRRSSPEE